MKSKIALFSLLCIVYVSAQDSLSYQNTDSSGIDGVDAVTGATVIPKTADKNRADFSYSLDLQSGYLAAMGNDSSKGNMSVLGVYRHQLSIPHGIYFPTDIRLSMLTVPGVDYREFTAVEKYTTPSSLLAYSGIGWKGPVNASIRGLIRSNSGSMPLALPWSPSQESSYLDGWFKERRHVGYEIVASYPHERFSLGLESQTIFANQLYVNSSNESLNSSNETDADWFLTGDGTFKILDTKVMAAANVFYKDDLAEDNAYDLLFGKLGISTNTKIKKRLQFWGGLYGRAYDNRRMEERGYLNEGGLFKNIGIASDLRTVWDLRRQLYVKADLETDISNRMSKTKYDLAVRKMWRRQNISSQLGFWSTPGALFPRTCTYYSGSFGVGEQISLVPNARMYWQWDRKSDEYKYNHTDLNFEINYKLPVEQRRIFTRMSFHGGVDCKLFETNPIGEDYNNWLFFSDQVSGYLGIRSYL